MEAPGIILQTTALPDEVCPERELYYRESGETARTPDGILELAEGSRVSTDTYMNLLDADAWERYGEISGICLQIRLQGRGRLRIYRMGNPGEAGAAEERSASDELLAEAVWSLPLPEEKVVFLPEDKAKGLLYWQWEAWEDSRILESSWQARAAGRREICLSLVICTYHRRAQLERNLARLCPGLEKLERERGYASRILVVDNGRELGEGWPEQYGGRVRLYLNPNTGGSGGFGRGMEETVRNLPEFPATHVLLMDDDAELQMESIARLCALLSCLREEYRKEAVAGRMFRTDRRQVQYTAAEIWNGGEIRHIGWNLDMGLRENLPGMNDNRGAQYGGWWMCCYPIEYIKANRPLPFFLHCDDVEYGLRQGGKPLILNGIQVWHETYEKRQDPVITYYDVRNSLFVNELYSQPFGREEILGFWKGKISECHRRGDYLGERMGILGLRDYLKGWKELEGINPEGHHRRLSRKRYATRLGNAVLWRLAQLGVRRRGPATGQEPESG